MSLELGINLYREQRFQECHEALSSFCLSSGEDLSEKILALEYLLKISGLLKTEIDVIKTSIEVLSHSDHKSKEKIISLMNYNAKSVWDISLSSDEIYKIAKAFEDIGAYSKASEFLNEICELFLKNFRINILAKLIQNSDQYQLKHNYTLDNLLIVAISTGDKSKVDHLLSDSVADLLDRSNHYYQAFNEIRPKLAKNIQFWKGNIVYSYEILSRIDGVPVEGAAHDRKKIVNMILDTIMVHPRKQNTYVLLGEYSLKFSRKDLCEKTIKALRLFLTNDDKDLLAYIRKLEAASLKMKNVKEASGNFDFGEDLFETAIDEGPALENKLLYFINSNEYDLAKDIYEKLLAIQSESKALAKFLEFEKKISKSQSSLLTKEPLAFGKQEKKEDVILEAQLNKVIEMFDESFLDTNIKDIASCLKFIEMHKVLIKQLTHVLAKGPSLELSSLLAQAYFDDNNFYKCLDVCYEVMEGHLLNEDEHCFFLYLIAESYLAIDMRRKALEVYKEISGIRKNYRMTNERMRELR